MSGPTGTSILDRAARWMFRHWLALANAGMLIYAGLPWLSPWLIASGYPQLGKCIFWLYKPLCHQMPERSFWFMGHQVAFCHRDAAIYTTLFAGGVLFGLLRRYVRPIRYRTMGLLILPMVLDGATHMLNDILPFVVLRSANHAIWSFNWWMRMVTGVLFAVAVIWGIYTRLDEDLRKEDEQAE